MSVHIAEKVTNEATTIRVGGTVLIAGIVSEQSEAAGRARGSNEATMIGVEGMAPFGAILSNDADMRNG
jgi:hypothetical protein